MGEEEEGKEGEGKGKGRKRKGKEEEREGMKGGGERRGERTKGEENTVIEDAREIGIDVIINPVQVCVVTHMYKLNTYQTSCLHVAESLSLGLIH